MAKVLMIEDDADIRGLYIEGLRQQHKDIEIFAANSAQAALDALDEIEPDVVILDIMLPAHNGVTVMYEMQSYGDWSNIPIIVFSSIRKKDLFTNEQLLAKLNVVEYCYKPTTPPSKLAEAVGRVVGVK